VHKLRNTEELSRKIENYSRFVVYGILVETGNNFVPPSRCVQSAKARSLLELSIKSSLELAVYATGQGSRKMPTNLSSRQI
jgi:hypothetical protein